MGFMRCCKTIFCKVFRLFFKVIWEPVQETTVPHHGFGCALCIRHAPVCLVLGVEGVSMLRELGYCRSLIDEQHKERTGPCSQ